MAWLGDRRFGAWPERPRVLRLYLDPLYVLRARLQPSDIVLCHDIGPITLSELYPPPVVEQYLSAYAKLSEARPGHGVRQPGVAGRVRRRVRRRLPLPALHPAVRACRIGAGPRASRCRPSRTPFLLSVGALERRKNHLRTIAAFANSGLAGRGVSLVICGARGDATDSITQQAALTPGCRYPATSAMRSCAGCTGRPQASCCPACSRASACPRSRRRSMD